MDDARAEYLDNLDRLKDRIAYAKQEVNACKYQVKNAKRHLGTAEDSLEHAQTVLQELKDELAREEARPYESTTNS